jgi:uncharacterized protein YbjT (DUF2867 family)
MKVAIAGASGFIGKHLMARLRRDPAIELRPLARSLTPSCDLFSLLDVEKALEGQDEAIYLVHSMLPSSELSQGSFADYDLILADNFARAAKKNGLKRILYLGGIVPSSQDSNPDEWSPHLRSRFEVEEIFRSYGIPLLALRAGMVMGAEGSSFQLLVNLVNRLPVMLCPAWTLLKTSPIHVDDVAESFFYALQHPDLVGVRDLQGPESLSYREMLQGVSRHLDKHRTFFGVPFFSPELSKLWVRTVTGAPKSLVYPLVESLNHDMRPNPEQALRIPAWTYTKFDTAMEEVVRQLGEPNGLNKPKAYVGRVTPDRSHVVQSVQRHDLPPGKDAEWASREYARWLNSTLSGLVTVNHQDDKMRFCITGTKSVLLELTLSKDRSRENRMLFYITGGLLNAGSKRGRLEFRTTPDGKYLITAIHDFRPRLPWYLYKYSQALVHANVMRRFSDHLRAIASRCVS